MPKNQNKIYEHLIAPVSSTSDWISIHHAGVQQLQVILISLKQMTVSSCSKRGCQIDQTSNPTTPTPGFHHLNLQNKDQRP